MVSRRRIGLSPASFRSVEGTERNGASEITETGVRNGSTTIRFDSAVVDFADLLKVEIPTVGRNGRHRHVSHSLVFDHWGTCGGLFPNTRRQGPEQGDGGVPTRAAKCAPKEAK